MEEKTMPVVTFRIDPDTYIQLLAIAEREDRTFSDIVRQSINYYIEKLK